MKRSRIVVFLVLVVTLALPALIHADVALAGWTWDEATAVPSDAPVPDSTTPDAVATPDAAAATQASP